MASHYRFTAAFSQILLAYFACMSISHAAEQCPTDDSPADARRLYRKIKVDFENQPLKVVLQKLADQADLKLVINEKHLITEGVTSDTPVSIKLAQEISIRSALTLTVQEYNLAYKVQAGKLHIVSPSYSSQNKRKYYLDIFFAMSPQEATEFVKQVRRTNSPKSWRANGGSMWLRLSDDADVLTAFGTSEMHDDIYDLLQPFREARWRALQASKKAELASTEQRQAHSAADMKQTDILPHAVGEIRRGRNYVYQIATQLAWNRLRQQVAEPIRLERNPPLAKLLNTSELKLKDVSNESYVAAAGTTKDGVVERIREEMKDKFPRKQVDLPRITDENALLLYAYLYKRLAFDEDFERLDKPLAFHVGRSVRNVASFGIEKATLRNSLITQVTIRDYNNDDDFIIELETKSENDELILAKVEPSRTLAATIQSVQRRMDMAYETPSLRDGDSLVVPILDLHVATQDDELLNKRLMNADWRNHYLLGIRAIVRFRLDEKGVTLEESAIPLGRSLEKPKPRHLVFDKPFLVFMKQRKSNSPYFAMWVENDEVMERFAQTK